MKEISSIDFQQEVLNSGKAIVDFYSTDCPPCEALAPTFEDLSKVYGVKVKFIKIFRQENRDLADKLGVRSSPTLLFFDNGKEVAGRLTGGILRSQIIKNIEKMLE